MALLLIASPLLGVILGWGLNWWTNSRQEQMREIEARKREIEERQHVRMLLRLETKHNVKALVEFWAKVTVGGVHIPGMGNLVGVGQSPQDIDFDQNQRLALEPLPEWRYLMWESQAGLVAKALSPAEIERVYALYSDLKTFTVRRAELRALFDTPEGKRVSELYSAWMQRRFSNPTLNGVAPNVMETLPAFERDLGIFNEQARPFWNECLPIYSRLENTYRWLLGKQDRYGRWKLENSLNSKMWIDIEQRGKPSKWITLRALRALKDRASFVAETRM